ncbi:Mu-class gst glutathione S-transferase [Fasciolopsis buskii]|uniref:glutathione transferase n=1 Tax=Fasciolopsis buskii TaxID=27845 RepID=A0A8E0RSI7_9TREM|nr:Mu-class gst glutathione S-transferase [Fasciolopsis buski]
MNARIYKTKVDAICGHHDRAGRSIERNMPAILGYWKIRGLAQPIRMLLEYYGVEYEEHLYGKEDQEKWLDEKFNLGLDLPNLPYYIDGNVKLTQSMAIMRYISEKHGTPVGSTPEERAKLSMIEGAAMDLRMRFGFISYFPNFEEQKVEYLKELPRTLKMWSRFLGDHHYLTGPTISHIDFLVYEALDAIHYVEPHCLDEFGNLKQFMSRIENLPQIKKYMGSERFIKWPLHLWRATFGGGDEPPF